MPPVMETGVGGREGESHLAHGDDYTTSILNFMELLKVYIVAYIPKHMYYFPYYQLCLGLTQVG